MNEQIAKQEQRQSAKHGQRPSLQRHPSGPIGDCGQQKSGDCRRGVTKDHLMRVPDRRLELCRQGQPRGIGAQPKRDRHRGLDRSPEKKGSETSRQDHGAGK